MRRPQPPPIRVLGEIARRNRAGDPVTLWVHPWEIDPDPPRVPLPADKRFAHYFRLSGFEARLAEVLKGASFATIGDMLAQDQSRCARAAPEAR